MPKANLYNMAGEQVGEVELSESVFGAEPNSAVLHESVKNHLANRRQGTQSALTRAEVSGGGRKPWRQKGTGRARQGTIRAPHWRGGGVVFGPHPRDYSKKVNKKAVALAFRRALSEKIAKGAVVVVDGLEGIEPKTRAVAALLKKIAGGKATLFVTAESVKNLNLAARNIPGVEVTTAAQANTYQVVRYPLIVTDAAGLDALQARISEEE